jgi:hypothetical protein
LHALGNVPNPYEQATSIIGRTLADFDDDNLIPCYGFGDGTFLPQLQERAFLLTRSRTAAWPKLHLKTVKLLICQATHFESLARFVSSICNEQRCFVTIELMNVHPATCLCVRSFVVQFFPLSSCSPSCTLLLGTTHDQHVFSFFPGDRPCQGFEEALARYRTIIPHVKLAGKAVFLAYRHCRMHNLAWISSLEAASLSLAVSTRFHEGLGHPLCKLLVSFLRVGFDGQPLVAIAGPTSFAPIIDRAVGIVEASGGQYHILLIIADGQVGPCVTVSKVWACLNTTFKSSPDKTLHLKKGVSYAQNGVEHPSADNLNESSRVTQ